MFNLFCLNYFVRFSVGFGLSVHLELTSKSRSETAEGLVLINILRDSLYLKGSVNLTTCLLPFSL